jgi:hypothetical protein
MNTSSGFAPIGIAIGLALAVLALVLFFNLPPSPTSIAAGVGVSAWSLFYLLQYSAVLAYESHGRKSEATVPIRASYTGPAQIGLIRVDGDMPRWMAFIRGLAIVCLVTFWISVLVVIVSAQMAKN